MTKIVKGSEAEALVNTVNTVGVMGKGVALQFRQAFPDEYYKDYQQACKRDEIKIGKMHVFETGKLTNPRFIVNFPTKSTGAEEAKSKTYEPG